MLSPIQKQVATKIPIQGEFGKSSTDVVDAIWELLRNAFIQALVPSIDNQISLNSVDAAKPEHKNLLQKIFGKKDKKSNK